ncbi:MAG: hypothetical protein ACHP7N_15805 [Caulobacterales bacterium]
MRAAAFGLIAAIACAGAAGADTPPTPPAPAQTVSPQAIDRALRLETGMMRLAAGVSFQGFWSAGTPSFHQAAAILAPRSPGEARLWTDFFAHAIEVRQIQGDTAVTGWRDPVTDVWVLGDWSREGDGWRLNHVTMALTQALSGRFPPGADLQPAFPDIQEGLSKALVIGQVEALSAFRRAAGAPGAIDWSATAPSAERARTVAVLRLRAAENSIEAMASVVPYAGHVLRVALVEETPLAPGVSASVATSLHERSVETRLSLQPIQYLPGKGEVLAIVQSSFEPQWLFVAHLTPTGQAHDAKVANVEAIDLSKIGAVP